MRKKQDMREWQQTETDAKAIREQQRKQKALDDAANRYRVIENGETLHETSNESEAVRMAEKINAKVLWLIDGHGIKYIYP